MPALARDYTVIAVDQRGMGLTEKADSGYDSATLANDLVALMDELGYERFSVVGLDTGMVISYALAADHPERVARLIVCEAPLPGVPDMRPLPLFLPAPAVPRLWHLTFNRLDGINEQLVRGREDLFFSFNFDDEATIKLPDYAVRYYAKGFASSRAALRGSFGFYRAWGATTEQKMNRSAAKLTMPVLSIGGDTSSGEGVRLLMQNVADDVQGVVIPGAGQFVADEAPEPITGAGARRAPIAGPRTLADRPARRDLCTGGGAHPWKRTGRGSRVSCRPVPRTEGPRRRWRGPRYVSRSAR